ncbi:hypothetical protein B4Q13_25270 [Lacticaseibacillus rhamnosus]
MRAYVWAAADGMARGIGFDPERGIDVLCRRSGTQDDEVRLVGIARVADLAGDHLEALVATQEPAPDAIAPTEGLTTAKEK